MTKLLFIGRPSKYKGFDVLIQALQNIEVNKWELTVIGEYNGMEYRDYNIKFEGKQPNYKVAEYIRLTDILVVPSLYETFGNTALEGMACAKPIIASNVGGLKSLINDNVNGLLFNVGDIDDLTSKINYLIDNKDYREKLGQNGYEKSKNYTWKTIAKTTDVLLKGMI